MLFNWQEFEILMRRVGRSDKIDAISESDEKGCFNAER
jgi:hypothetical protein